MKKYLLILTVFFIIPFAQGQTNVYHSFPDSAIWRVDYHSHNPFQYPYEVKYYFQYYVTGDTLINSNIYKKIFKSYVGVDVLLWSLPTDPPTPTPAYYAGALRDDSLANKTFFVFPNTATDSLLYDYNLIVGDTVKGLISEYANMVVLSVDSILITGQYRTRWNLNHWSNDSINIIEGIGSSAGLIEQLYSYNIDFTDRYLVCVKDSSSTIFVSDYNSTIGCNLIYEGLNEIISGYTFKCYPNPFTTKITIQTEIVLKNASLIVYNSFGQRIKQMDNISGQSFTLHRDNLPSGVYFLQVTQDNNTLITDKLVITDN